MNIIFVVLLFFYSVVLGQDKQWINYPATTKADKLVEYENYIWISGNGLTRINKQTNEIKTYNSSNSTIPNYIRSFAFDSEGSIYIASGCRLLKFENDKLSTSYQRCSYDTSPGYDIFIVAVDKNNLVWTGWHDRLYSHHNQLANMYEILHDSSSTWFGYSYNNIRVIIFEDSTLWLGSSGDGLCKFNKNKYEVYTTLNSKLQDGTIRDIAIDSNGVKWIATYNGLTKFDDYTWEIYSTSNSPLTSNSITAVSIDSDNNTWIGTKNGLFQFGNEWTVYNSVNTGIISNEINDVLVDSENNIWITTATGGIYKYDRSTWHSFNSGFPSGGIRCIVTDQNNVKWIGTSSGLVKFSGNEWTLYNKYNSGLTSNVINDIEIDKNGILWIATGNYLDLASGLNTGGVSTFDGENNWGRFSRLNSGVPQDYVTSIEIDKNNVKWIGCRSGGGLVKYNDKNWEKVTFIDNRYSSNVMDMKIDRDGKLFVILEYGDFIYFDGVTWKSVKFTSDLSEMTNISFDSENNIWVGYKNGIIKFYSEGYTIYSSNNSCIPNDISVQWVEVDAEDNIWFSSNLYGITKWNEMDCASYNSENSGLIGKNVRYFYIDENNTKWISDYGLSLFNENGIVNIEEKIIPKKYQLYQNFPNPFNPMTTIKYSIPNVETLHATSQQNVTLKVYDLLGREIKTLVDGTQIAGNYEVTFDGSNLSSGIYFYRLRVDSFSKLMKMVLIK